MAEESQDYTVFDNPEILTTLEELDRVCPDWRKILLSMYAQGASDREIMMELGISEAVFEMLYGDLECDFRQMVDFGRLASQAWWESLGRKNLHNPKFQTALYKFNMGNRFEWTERSETSRTNIEHRGLDRASLEKEVEQLIALLDGAGSN